jgi:Ribonuclease HI
VAEYAGLREAIERALRQSPENVVFEVDSLLVASQVSGIWACRDATFEDDYSACIEGLDRLRARGVSAFVRHAYREYNATADSLASAGTEPALGPGGRQASST